MEKKLEEKEKEHGEVVLVLADDARGGIIFAFTDKEEALKRARIIGGIVAMAPIVYRAPVSEQEIHQ